MSAETLELRGPVGSQQVRVAYYGATPVTYPEAGTRAWVVDTPDVRVRFVEEHSTY